MPRLPDPPRGAMAIARLAREARDADVTKAMQNGWRKRAAKGTASVGRGQMARSTIHLILKPSLLEGVGVFALTPIKRGDKVPLFAKDDSKIIARHENSRLPKAYSRYHVPDEDERWWGPIDYHRMSIGWYLNHSPTPNIDVLADFTALRRIKIGEELTIDYSYSKFDWVNDKNKRHGRPPYKLLD